MQRRSSYLFALVRSGFASMATEIFAKCEMPTNVRGTSLEDVEMKPRMLALSHKRREGKLYSRVPFGWREGNDKALVPVPAEQKALAAAKKMREAGESFQAISDFLSKTVKPKGGGKWYPASARQAMRSKMIMDVA